MSNVIKRMDKNSYLGDNPACKSAAVTFFVSGVSVNPREITRRLKIQPTRDFAKGDIYESKAGQRARGLGHWAVESSFLVKSTSIEEHALALLRLLEPRKRAIRAFVNNTTARVAISFWWEAVDHHGGFTLTSGTLKRLSHLCSEVDFHFVS